MQVMEPGVEFSLEILGSNGSESLPLVFVHEIEGKKVPGTTSEEVLLALISRHTHMKVGAKYLPIDNPYTIHNITEMNSRIVRHAREALECQKAIMQLMSIHNSKT